MSKLQKFKDTYGKDPFMFLEGPLAAHYSNLKKLPFDTIEEFFERVYPEYEAAGREKDKEQIIIDLIEVYQEAGKPFPRKLVSETPLYMLNPTPVYPKVPKARGVLYDLKDIVGKDESRLNLTGVYVDPEEKLVATDAHAMVIYDTELYSQYKNKIIDVKTYVKSKGKDLKFIDEKYPDWRDIIKKEYDIGFITFDIYVLYNWAASYKDCMKYLVPDRDTSMPMVVQFESLDGSAVADKKGFNPDLLLKVTKFALQYDYNDAYTINTDIHQSRALVLDFYQSFTKGVMGLRGLVMPMVVKEDAPYWKFEEIVETFGRNTTAQKAAQSKRKSRTAKLSVEPEPSPEPMPQPTPEPIIQPVNTGAYSLMRALETAIINNLKPYVI